MEEISNLLLALLFLAILVIGVCVLMGIGALLIVLVEKLTRWLSKDGERRKKNGLDFCSSVNDCD